MKVAVASACMDLVSGASQLAITLCDALMRMGHEPYIVSEMNGYFALRYCVGRVKIYTPLEFQHIPEPDAAIICHTQRFLKMKNIKDHVFYIMGWSHMDWPSYEVPEYAAVTEELAAYLKFLGAKSTTVVNCAVDLPRIKVGPALRKTKPKVLIATTKTIPRQQWYAQCEKLGWEAYQPAGPYPIPNLHKHYPEVDIVIGSETVTLEALAANRAAFVVGPWGFDGWVTPDNVMDFNKNANSGRFHCHSLDNLSDALSMYKPSMGEYGRAICNKHFNPIDKAADLLDIAMRTTKA